MRVVRSIIVAILAVLAFGIIAVLSLRNYDSHPKRGCIAHAGGAIDGYAYTNSREALENAIANDFEFIELDLGLTSDSVLVAVHDWGWYRQICGMDITDEALGYDEFMRQLIHGKYHPLSANMIDSIFAAHPETVLVTDKIDDADLISRWLPSLKGRLITECFSDETYGRVKQAGIYPLRNFYEDVPTILGKGRPYVLDKESYDRIKDSKLYKVATLLFNCRMNIYILKLPSTKSQADSLMAADPFIEHVYIDEWQ